MHTIPLPEIDDESVLANCVAVKAKELRDRFALVADALHDANVRYEESAEASDLVSLSTIVDQAGFQVTAKELKALYAAQLRHKSGPERSTYDKLRLGARRCPFCSHRPPRTLDHYLPRDSFSEFSVFSRNLVPCCRDCNSTKHARVLSPDEQLVHPYFDTISDYSWLKCVVAYEETTPICRFRVDEDVGFRLRC